MARLIDADELQEVITQDWFLDILLTQTSKYDMAKKLVDMIDSVPLAYDVEKVVEELEANAQKMSEAKGNSWDSSDHRYYKAIGTHKAEQIIRRGGVE